MPRRTRRQENKKKGSEVNEIHGEHQGDKKELGATRKVVPLSPPKSEPPKRKPMPSMKANMPLKR